MPKCICTPEHSFSIPLLGLALWVGCSSGSSKLDLDSATDETGTPSDFDHFQDEQPEDESERSEDEQPGDSPGPDDDTGEEHPRLADDATIQNTSLPTSMACGEVTTGSISVRNTGTATWTRASGYKLGTVDDEDPFYSSDTRVWLSEDVEVSEGQIWTFDIALQAPEVAGSYTTDWQMVHEGVQWFGESTGQDINVTCDTPSDTPGDTPGDTPSAPAGAPVLDDVVWLHSDVSGWAETSVLSSVYVSGSQICLDYDMADVWPIYDLRGTDVVANPWVFIWQDETWYAATWEWMRPGQTCKSFSSVAGDHIKSDPFGEHSGWEPTSGQTYWFMVSGLGRGSERTVSERTNIVSFVWP